MSRSKFVCGAFKSDMSDVPTHIQTNSELPKEYTLETIGDVYDQGNRGICVSVSMKELIDYNCLKSNKKSKLPLDKFYNERKDKSLDGMTVREAMTIASKEKLIDHYAKIQDPDTLKATIYSIGPCIVCLPVCNYDYNFWKGDKILGGHALVTVGWNYTGFILKNSWGYSFGTNGETTIPYEDWNYITELWTTL